MAVLWGSYRYREAQRQQLARVRDHIAKDLHDDMGSTLSSIRIFSEVAQGQLAGAHPQTVALLQRISTNASTLAEAMQDIIWTTKPHQEDGLADVVSRMREFGLRLTEARGIAFGMRVDEPFPVLRLSLEQRRNLYLVFKENINNAVQYAGCTAPRCASACTSASCTYASPTMGKALTQPPPASATAWPTCKPAPAPSAGRCSLLPPQGRAPPSPSRPLFPTPLP